MRPKDIQLTVTVQVSAELVNEVAWKQHIFDQMQGVSASEVLDPRRAITNAVIRAVVNQPEFKAWAEKRVAWRAYQRDLERKRKGRGSPR